MCVLTNSEVSGFVSDTMMDDHPNCILSNPSPANLPPSKQQNSIGHGFNLFSVELVKAKANPEKFVDGLVQHVAKNRIVFEVRGPWIWFSTVASILQRAFSFNLMRLTTHIKHKGLPDVECADDAGAAQ